MQIVELAAQGLTAREISKAMGLTSELCMRHRLRLIYDKVGVSNRVELAIWWVHHFGGEDVR
jgi:DNA-binding NarL/FixJ family response regulator